MKKKLLIVLLSLGMISLFAGCTERTDSAGTVINEQEEAKRPESGEEEKEDVLQEQADPEKTVSAEEPAGGGLAKPEDTDAGESPIVLENGQPDANATAVVYYIFEKEYTDQNKKVYGKTTYTIPQLAMRSMEAGMINQDILSWFEDSLAYADQAAKALDGLEDSDALQYTLDVQYSLTYLDETKICLLLSGYEYSGGAHGMPFRTALIYDLNSGQKIETEDLFDVTEEDFSTLFTEAFSDLIAESPGDYWADAMDYVHEEASLENENYYLTETGVTFYFEPYVLAAYAYGYIEAEIPYDRLPLKQSQ